MQAPKKSKPSAAAAKEDDDFLDNDVEEDEEEDEKAEELKRVKAELAALKSKQNAAAPPAVAATAAGASAQAEYSFTLTANRKVTVKRFGKAKLVDIREWYEKDGKTLPGKACLYILCLLSRLLALTLFVRRLHLVKFFSL